MEERGRKKGTGQEQSRKQKKKGLDRNSPESRRKRDWTGTDLLGSEEEHGD